MTQYKHIVQVHPIENGQPNLYEVKAEYEFDTEQQAEAWVGKFNTPNYNVDKGDPGFKAVYLGRVNEATGELE